MISLPKCSAIILDKDGTITDSHVYWGHIIEARAQALASWCIQTQGFDSLQIQLEICMGWDRSIQKLLPHGPIALRSRSEVISTLVAYLSKAGHSVGQDQISKIFHSVQHRISDRLIDYVHPLPGALNFMKKVHDAGIQLCLVTSDQTVNAETAMRACGAQDYLEFIVGGDLGYGDKSMGGPAIHACNQLRRDPSEVICIGDAKMDWDMHKNASLYDCVLVGTGQTPLEELRRLGGKVVLGLDNIKL